MIRQNKKKKLRKKKWSESKIERYLSDKLKEQNKREEAGEPGNEVEKNNAIHGLLYTRKFELVNKKATSNEASVTLQYKYNGTSEGFPFPFDFLLTYNYQLKIH